MFCRTLLVVLAMSVFVATSAPSAAQDARKQDEQAIRATANAYRAALAKGDAKAIAQFWTKDGYYIDEAGHAHPAAELVAEVDTAAGSPPEVKVTASDIRFLTADVALEDGASEVVWRATQHAPPDRGHYHALWVREDGRWRLASLCEVPLAPPAHPTLADLSWMVGIWTAEDDGATIELTARSNATGTFLLRDLRVLRSGNVVRAASQRIGVDPLTRKLKSWTFDSDGGYNEAAWTQEGKSWIAQSTGVLADGRQTAATTIITFDGQDSFTRKSVAARVDGRPVPDQQMRFTRRTDRTR